MWFCSSQSISNHSINIYCPFVSVWSHCDRLGIAFTELKKIKRLDFFSLSQTMNLFKETRFLHVKDTIQGIRILTAIYIISANNDHNASSKNRHASREWGGQSWCQEVEPELSLVWTGKKTTPIYICTVLSSFQNTHICWFSIHVSTQQIPAASKN